jgi:hypothetical protein
MERRLFFVRDGQESGLFYRISIRMAVQPGHSLNDGCNPGILLLFAAFSDKTKFSIHREEARWLETLL